MYGNGWTASFIFSHGIEKYVWFDDEFFIMIIFLDILKQDDF